MTWAPEPSTSHERMVFIAARDGIAGRSRRWWHNLIRVGGGMQSSLPSAADSSPMLRPDKELRSREMQIGVVVADQLAARFTPFERERLRSAGELPSWFWGAYDEGVRVERRRR